MIQKLIEKLNKKRLKERISSAIVMVALIVSISGVVGAVSGIIVSNRYNYALKKLRIFSHGGYRQDDDYVCRYEKLSACCDRISGWKTL